VTLPARDAQAVLGEAETVGVPAVRLGTTGGDALTGPDLPPISLRTLRDSHEGWLPTYMSAGA
jgi:phosphoribosylformylglycinamidine synthase